MHTMIIYYRQASYRASKTRKKFIQYFLDIYHLQDVVFKKKKKRCVLHEGIQ